MILPSLREFVNYSQAYRFQAILLYFLSAWPSSERGSVEATIDIIKSASGSFEEVSSIPWGSTCRTLRLRWHNGGKWLDCSYKALWLICDTCAVGRKRNQRYVRENSSYIMAYWIGVQNLYPTSRGIQSAQGWREHLQKVFRWCLAWHNTEHERGDSSPSNYSGERYKLPLPRITLG